MGQHSGASYPIRPLTENDLPAALTLAWEVFLEFDAPDCSSEGVDTFREYLGISPVTERPCSVELRFWGCFDGETIVGVIALRPACHISLLFVHRDYQRGGIGARLVREVRAFCSRANTASRLTVHASPSSRGFYRQMGFVDVDVEQCVDGIRYIPMASAYGPEAAAD